LWRCAGPQRLTTSIRTIIGRPAIWAQIPPDRVQSEQ